MNKIIQFVLLLSLLISAAISTPSAMAAPLHADGQLTLGELGLDSDLVMRGPYDTGTVRFDLPATWKLQPGAELAIEVKSSITGSASLLESQFSGATLEVYFNDNFLESIPLLSSEQTTYYVPISPEALISANPGGWHELSFFLFSEFDCTLDFHKTTVSIDTNSVATFPYEPTALSLDLRRLPWPIYLEHTREMAPVNVVIPTDPTADEMQSALVVMGALGRMTGGDLPLTMVTVDELTETQRAQSHLILVGKPAAFSSFSGLTLPVALTGGLFTAPELQGDDGVIQLLPSPWDTTKAILMVSGNTDAAVVKASQALSTLNLQTGTTADYSIISQVFPAPPVGVSETDGTVVSRPSDLKLADLGYASTTATGMGTNWIDFQFTIPLGLVPQEAPYIDLSFSTSSLVDPQRSEGVVFLNDVQIGSVPLTVDASNVINTRIDFPPSVLRSGTNNLSIVFNLLPFDECTVFTFDSLWVTVYADSMLHLPLVDAPTSSFSLQDIKGYPYPFAMDPSLSTTAFIVSKQDPNSWLQASRIAYDLGARVAGSVLGFEAAFDGEIPDEVKAMNLILVGEPKDLGIVSELKTAMPAYFETDSNVAVLDSQQVIYRISDAKSLGYLELFPSPWSNERAISGIFGTTSAGLDSAIDALLNVQSRESFSGDFITIDGTTAHIVDTRTGTGMGNILISLNPSTSQNDAAETAVPTQSSNAQTAYARNRQLILMGTAVVGALIVLTAGVALWTRRKRK